VSSQRPSLSAFITNLHAPMPWHRKLWLLARNNLIKIRTGSACCGHEGEPGC
jgi:hypothetical protein